MAEFLKLVEDGKVPKGSVLIVESLDRLTREDITTALKFFMGILDAGVNIATTSPEYLFRYDDKSNRMQDIMLAVVVLCRGNEESAMKSKRIGEAWASKRQKAKAGPITATCPAWLKLRDDRSGFEIIEDKADTVRKIFQLAADGYGVFRITRKLNQDCTPTMGNKPGRQARQWYESYVIRILSSRAVLGEYQPCTRDDKNRSVPQGDAVANYYPPIVCEADFVAARRAIDSRALGFKRTGKDIPNIFGRLIRNARDGGGFLYIPPKKKSPIARLEPVGGRNGASAPLSFRYRDLEEAFLSYLKEVTVEDLTGKQRVSKADQIEYEVKDLKKRIDILESRMETDDDLGGLLDKLKGWKAKMRTLEKELEAERNPTDEGRVLEEVKGVIDLIQENPEHYRTKLKQLLHLIVSEMWLLVFEYKGHGSRDREITMRAAVLQIHFKAGHFRSIWVEYDGAFHLEGKHVLADLRTYRDEQPWDLPALFRTRWRDGG